MINLLRCVVAGFWGVIRDVDQTALCRGEAGNTPQALAGARVIGALERRLVLTVESSLSDKELIERLSGGDPEKLAAARLLLGAAEGFPEGGLTEDHEGETRH